MRELVYLSEAKLQSFAVDKPGRWRNTSQVEGEVKAFGLGAKLNLTPGGRNDAILDLDRVVSALEGSDRAPKWFADDNVQPGDWVHYEAPLGYASVLDMVVFLDSDQPTPAYPTDGTLRLLLHGSSKHLVGAPAEQLSYDDARAVNLTRSSFGFALQGFRSLLKLEGADRDGDVLYGKHGRKRPSRIVTEFNTIVTILDARLEARYTAAWMAGYARVTALLPHRPGSWNDPRRPTEAAGKIVVATPLYVEYISQPSVEG